MNKTKHCISGSAHITNGYTEEKRWHFRRQQKYCAKCGRPVSWNNETGRWIHLQESKK